MVENAVAQTRHNLDALGVETVEDIRHAGRMTAGFSESLAEAEQGLKKFLDRRMYRHQRVERIMQDAAGIVAALFRRYMANPAALPKDWGHGVAAVEEDVRARRICDFIAGMTDPFAVLEHRRLFDATPELR